MCIRQGGRARLFSWPDSLLEDVVGYCMQGGIRPVYQGARYIPIAGAERGQGSAFNP